jgi:chorismate synthase
VPRAVPIVESMVAIVVFDQLLQQKATNFSDFNV